MTLFPNPSHHQHDILERHDLHHTQKKTIYVCPSLANLSTSHDALLKNLKPTELLIKPIGFAHPQLPNHVCQLHKSLYGLKQAPRACFEKVPTCLISLCFICSIMALTFLFYLSM